MFPSQVIVAVAPFSVIVPQAKSPVISSGYSMMQASESVGVPGGLHVEATFEGNGVVLGTTLYVVANEMVEKIRKQRVVFIIGLLECLACHVSARGRMRHLDRLGGALSRPRFAPDANQRRHRT